MVVLATLCMAVINDKKIEITRTTTKKTVVCQPLQKLEKKVSRESCNWYLLGFMLSCLNICYIRKVFTSALMCINRFFKGKNHLNFLMRHFKIHIKAHYENKSNGNVKKNVVSCISRHHFLCEEKQLWKFNDVSEIQWSSRTWLLYGVTCCERGLSLQGCAKGFLCSDLAGHYWIYSIPCWHEKKVKTSWWRQNIKSEWELSHDYMHFIPACCCQVSCHGLEIWIRIRNSSQLSQGPRESDVLYVTVSNLS